MNPVNIVEKQVKKPIIYAEDIKGKDGFYITYQLPAALAQTIDNFGTIFTALRPCELIEVCLWYSTATSTSPATLQIKKQIESDVHNAGTNILTTAYSLSATAKTNYFKGLRDFVSNPHTRRLDRGDRIGMVVSAANLTNLYAVVLTFYFKYTDNGEYNG